MSKYTETMRDVLSTMVEGFSKKEIKMAIGIASDPRYKGGNYTGAYKQIEKIKKGLASHPQVAAVLKRQYTSFDPEIAESGHDDVKSAKNQVQIAMSALEKMNTELGKLKDEDSLPTWWTNKVAVSVDKLDGMADYLDTQVEEVELDEGKMKQFHQMMDDGKSAQEIAKALKLDLKTVKELMKEEVELDEMKEPFVVVDTADGDKVVGTASSEKGAKEIITTAQLPPMKIKDKKTLKIVKVKKKQDIGYPLKEGTELDEAKEVLSRFKDDKLKKSIMNLATQKGLKVKEMGDKLEVSGNARKVMDLTLAVQKHDVKIEQNMMSAYTAAITKGVK